jgi:catechol 2,3-dioxygenase-like lactoylglutathione lyase family enzyme
MTKLGSLNHLRLTVNDVDRSAPFYLLVMAFLGYRLEERKPGRIAWEAPPGMSPQWFILTEATDDRAYLGHDRYSPGLHHIAWNADGRDEVDQMYQLLQTHRMTVPDPPAEYPHEAGYYAVFFADPDGIKLELVHVP